MKSVTDAVNWSNSETALVVHICLSVMHGVLVPNLIAAINVVVQQYYYVVVQPRWNLGHVIIARQRVKAA